MRSAPPRWRSWLRIAVGLLVGALVTTACSGSEGPDPSTLRGYGETYASLLSAGDEAGLRRHLNNPAQPDDAGQRIAALGGRHWTVRGVTWVEQTEGSYRLVVTVVDEGGAEQTWVDNVTYVDSRWRMAPRAGPTGGASTSRDPWALPLRRLAAGTSTAQSWLAHSARLVMCD